MGLTSVYVVQRDCPDYYCGCGGGHIVGIYTSAAEFDLAGPTHEDKVTQIPLNSGLWFGDDAFKRPAPNTYKHAWT